MTQSPAVDPRTWRVRQFASFEEIPGRYDALFAEAAARSFSLSRPWFENFAATALDAGDRLAIHAVEAADGTPLAILPVRQAARAGVGRPRRLTGASNYYSFVFAPVVASAAPRAAVLDALIGAVTRATPCDVIDLRPVPVDDPLYGDLLRSLRARGFAVQRYFSTANWFHPLAGHDSEGYFAGRTPLVRSCPKKLKLLQKSTKVRFELFDDPVRIDAGIDAYQRVYAASWKNAEPYPDFVPGLIRTCAARGWARLGILWVDEQPAAAQFWIVQGGTASIFKVAYDEAFAKQSVGAVLSWFMFRHAIDVDRVATVDYGCGDDAHKQQWMTERRELWGLTAFNLRTAPGAALAMREIGGRAVKRVARRVIDRARQTIRRPAPAPVPSPGASPS